MYIVYMGERQHDDPKVVTDSHYDMLTTLMKSKELARESMVYSYSHGFSGFAAKLTHSQAQQLSEVEEVVAVMRNDLYKIQTTRSWDYLGLSLSPQTPDNLLNQTDMGDGIIIGVLDTGIWPESKSFSDEGLGPIPWSWKGSCKSGENFDASKHCNKKIIGAHWYVDGLVAALGQGVNLSSLGEVASARDVDGHGTHVSSTAAGSYVAGVSYDGVGAGTARGGAPRARLAMYKVCWAVPGGGCASADILKGFDDAIRDGVHVLTLSIAASSLPLYSEVDGRDAIAVGSFHAVQKGITVVCGAGNDGPSLQTVKNIAPWIITVAASTMDRAFKTQITLGNNKTFVGESIYRGSKGSRFTSLYYPGETVVSRGACETLFILNPTLVAGNIVLCFTDLSTPAVTSFASSLVRQAGGAGVIVSKPPNDVAGRCGSLPCAEVDYEVGTNILFYVRSTKNPIAKFGVTTTVVGNVVSPSIADFSSRGPNSVAPSVLKPDIAAPGVQIIAATSGLDTSSQQGFTMLSGTSMATPHLAGIVALLRSLNPNWSPAAIRSALTTTGWTTDSNGLPLFAEGNPQKLADPFDYGGGIVNANGASCPGLVYDMDTNDYSYYLCAMGYSNSDISQLIGRPTLCPDKSVSILDVNLPSITIPYLRNFTTLTRTVTNVGAANSIYSVVVEPPMGTLVFVEPPILIFNSKIKKLSFKVTLTSMHQQSGGYNFGALIWTDGIHYVRSHVAVRSAPPSEYIFG